MQSADNSNDVLGAPSHEAKTALAKNVGRRQVTDKGIGAPVLPTFDYYSLASYHTGHSDSNNPQSSEPATGHILLAGIDVRKRHERYQCNFDQRFW